MRRATKKFSDVCDVFYCLTSVVRELALEFFREKALQVEEFRTLSRSRTFIHIVTFISFFLLLLLLISSLLRFSFSILARFQTNCAFKEKVLICAVSTLKIFGFHFLPLLVACSKFVQISGTKFGVKTFIVGLEAFFVE